MNIFDTDNIYDLLFADRVDLSIIPLINNALGNHLPSLGVIWLIERYCPNTAPWAANWTTLAYDFLKPLTRTHLLTNGEVNGSAYGFEPEYKADLPGNLTLAKFPDRVTLKVHKGQTVSITWLERSHQWDTSPNRQDVLEHEIDYALISSKKIVNAQGGEQVITIKIDNLICGTMAIDGNYQFLGNPDDINKIFKAGLPYTSFANWQSAETFGQEIQIKFPKQKKAITVEWLEKGISVKNARYCDKVGNLITCWHREERIYTAPKEEDLEVKLDSSFWLINSCVITGDGLLVGITNAQKELIMYEFLDKTLKDIFNQLNLTECKVLIGCDAIITSTWIFARNDISGWYSPYYWGVTRSVEYNNPIFSVVPENYSFIYLESKDFNKGREPDFVYDYESSILLLKFSFDEDNFFAEYKKTSRYKEVYEPIKLDLYKDQAWLKGDIGMTLGCIPSYHFPPNNRDFQASGNNSYTLSCVLNPYRDFRDGTFPVDWEMTEESLRNGLAYTTNSGYPDFALAFLPDNTVWRKEYFIYDGIADGEDIIWEEGRYQHWRKIGDWEEFFSVGYSEYEEAVLIFFNGLWVLKDYSLYNSSFFNRGPTGKRSRFWQDDQTTRDWYNPVANYTVTILNTNCLLELISDFDGGFSTILFTPDSDLDLFSSGKSVYVNSCLNQRRTMTNKWLRSESNFNFYLNADQIAIERLTTAKELLVDVSLEVPILTLSTIKEEKETLLSDSFSGEIENLGSFNIETQAVADLFPDGQMVKSVVVPLKRDLRINPRDARKIIKFYDNENGYKSYAPLPDNLLNKLLEPFDTTKNANNEINFDIIIKGNNLNFSYTRPFFDPDTDNGDIMPDSKRVQDIDFRLKHLCDWMGMAQQPDGSIKTFPDPYHHDDLSKLQGYQFAAFSKPENEVNPAAIYEVITNRATTDKHGKKEIKQGGFVKYFTFSQGLEQFFFDIAKGLGLQESGGIQVTKGDNSGVVVYESQLAINIDTLRTLSSVSKNVNELVVQAVRNMVLSQSILAATGVRISTQHIPFDINGETYWAEVACIAPGSPSLMDEMFNLELNTAIMIGGNLSVQEAS
jgi:hypothetical protein